MATIREKRSGGGESTLGKQTSGLTIRGKRTTQEQQQYAGSMRGSRLQEVDKVQQEAAKAAQEQSVKDTMRLKGIDLTGNVKRFGEFKDRIEAAPQKPKTLKQKVKDIFVRDPQDIGADWSGGQVKQAGKEALALPQKATKATFDLSRKITDRLPTGGKPLYDDGISVGEQLTKFNRATDIPGVTTGHVANFVRGAGDAIDFGIGREIDAQLGNTAAVEGRDTRAGKAGQITGTVLGLTPLAIKTGVGLARFGKRVAQDITGSSLGAANALGSVYRQIPRLDVPARAMPQTLRRKINAIQPTELFPERFRRTVGEASPAPAREVIEPRGTQIKGAVLNASAGKQQPIKQDLQERLFGSQGVGILPGTTNIKEMVDTHIVSRPRKVGPLADRVGVTASNVGYNLVDRFEPFKAINKETYDAAMDSSRANNLANITIKDKFVDLEGNVIGKSLAEVYDTVPRGMRNIADRYAIMRDAVSRMGRGLKVYDDKPWLPQTAEEAAIKVKEYEQKYPWLNTFGEDWNQFNRNRQDLWVSSDIASQKMVDTLRFTNPNYAPNFRQQEAVGLKSKLALNSSKAGFSGQKAPVMRAVGSTKKIIEPAQGMIETTGSSYNAMMRNRAMVSMYNAILNDPEKYKGVIEIVEETADMKQAALKSINDIWENEGPEGVTAFLNDEVNGIFKKAKQATGNQDTTVTVMLQGEPVKMRVYDPSLLKAVEGMSPEQLGSVLKVANVLSKGIKYSATGGLAPLQGLKLAFRDIPIAIAQSKDKKRVIFDIAHALVSQAADWLPNYVPGAQKIGNLARQYYRAGGGYEAYLKGDSRIRTISSDLTKDPILSGRNLLKTARKLNPFRPLQGFGNGLENVPRIAAFAAEMRRNGWVRNAENVRSAVDDGREATVNWSRRGSKGADLEAVFPYGNAAVQGTYRLVKRFKEQPISATALIMGIVGAKIAAHEMFKDDPDYQQRSRFEKGIPVEKTKDGKFRTLPVEPTEAFIADQILHFYKWAKYGESGPGVKETIQEGAEALLPKYASGPISSLTSQGKVFDASAAIKNTLGGSSLEPLRALDSGQNFFGGDIVPREYQGLETSLKYNETTSAAGKWAAENLGIDAFTFDYLGKKFGGDIAKIGLPMSSDVGKGDPAGNLWDETLTKLKLLEDPVMKNRLSDDYYNYADRVTQAKSAFDKKDIPLPNWYQSAYDEVTSQKKDSLAKRISELNTEKKEIERNISIGAKQRADDLRDVQRQINLLRIQGIKRLEELGVPKSKGR